MKSTIKTALLIFIISVVISASSVMCHCVETDDLTQDIKTKFESILDNDVENTLNEIGISDFSVEEIYNISFDKITKYFAVTLKDKVSEQIRSFSELFCVIIICSVFALVFNLDKTLAHNQIISIIIIILAVNIISESVSTTVSVLESTGKFALGFTPIYTLLISLTGSTASALTYNTFAFFIGEFLSSGITYIISDFMGIYFCLGISFAMNETTNLGRYVTIINKTISTVLGFVACIFTGLLSVRSILSVNLDSVSVKGIRFLISSMIPVLGSSISDAYSSLVGSINLIKGSVAIVAITVSIIINLPLLLENLVSYILLSMLSYMSECFLSNKIADILRFFASGIRILLLLCLFEVFIIIITVGIMLSVKGGI